VEERARSTPSVPDGVRLYAVGDIHGRADLLDRIADRIAEDAARHPSLRPLTIFLGDYIDRGPDSFAVIDRLASGDFPTPVLGLRGNHEEVLLKFVDDPGVLEAWRSFGGMETLFSYGVDVRDVLKGQGYGEARAAFLACLPEAHRTFFSNLRASYEVGDYFFCHAGVRPRVPLGAQADEDLLWIRSEFLESPLYHGKVVVHGHTPRPEPELRPNRINLDTGAYLTGRLTCLCLSGESRTIMSTSASARAEESRRAPGA
jgi:serine/threonine protein phosphatase 1